MKLRIRYEKRTTPVVIQEVEGGGAITVESVIDAVQKELNLDSNVGISLSLNGKDQLEDISAPVADYGIVSGDLIHVLLDESSLVLDTNMSNPKSGSGHKKSTKKKEKAVETPSDMDVDQEPSTSGASGHQGAACAPDEEGSEGIDPSVNKYLQEPMLCRESSDCQVPQLLQHLYKAADVKNAHDAVFVVIHTLMMEAGFQPLERENVVGKAFEMPPQWRSHGNYKLMYRHPACPGATSSLGCMPSGQLMTVHGIHKGPNAKHTCKLEIRSSDYVRSLKKDASKTFTGLANLSLVFKDTISAPLLQAMRQGLGLLPAGALLSIATELQMKIMSYLDIQSLVHVSGACKELRELAQNPYLWRRLYHIQFGSRASNDLDQEWLRHFKERWVERRRTRQEWEHMRMVVPPPAHFGQRPYPDLPFAPSAFPGVVGGDYDLNPNFGGIPGPMGPGPQGPGPLGPLGPMGRFPRPGHPYDPSNPHPHLPRPRFDPWGPPDHRHRPGRGGGMWDPMGGGGGMGGGFL